MEKIINYLEESIEDSLMSRREKRDVKSMVRKSNFKPEQLNQLRNAIFSIANDKINPDNYGLILSWLEEANKALVQRPANSVEANAYFSPGMTCKNTIIYHIQTAINTLKVCVFTISDDDITRALLLAHKKGVHVKIITDNDKSEDMGSDIAQLSESGIEVKMDNTSNHMHHKFCLVDNKRLITGSYNWTRSAAKYNHENILLLDDNDTLKQYTKEFEQLWDIMTPY